MYILLLVLLLVAQSAAQVTVKGVTITGVSVSTTSSCGPPNYVCARTDLTIVQVPGTPPNVGNLAGINTIVTDPDFGSRISRVTDANLDSHAPFQNRTYITTASGSADDNIWNTDSTLFYVQDTGSSLLPMTFNPATLQAGRLYVSSFPSTDGYKLGSTVAGWSFVNPQVLYSYAGTSISKVDFTDRVNPPTPTAVFDFATATCLGVGYTATWKTNGGVNYNDTIFGMAYSNAGNQGTGVHAVVYKVGSGCSLLDFSTGQVTGDWGATGTIDVPDRETIHNAKLSKDGNWLVISGTTCLLGPGLCHTGPFFWQVGTTHLTYVGQGPLQFTTGHFTSGYTHWVNSNNSPIADHAIRTFADPATVTDLLPALPGSPSGMTATFDNHQSWNNADSADSFPIFTASWTSKTTFPGPWYNEIIAIKPDGSGKVWRFAHSFITALSHRFDTQFAIGTVSQDGRFFAVSSDWLGTLGSEAGGSTCIIGTNCRGDVFVVELGSARSEDLVNWWINSSATQHLEGTSPVNPIYSQLGADAIKLWMLKDVTGHPWDLEQYNGSYFYHWITENGDAVPSAWTNASAYKRYLTPVRISPRFFVPNTTVVIDTPGPNSVERTINCGVDAQPLITIGDVRTITTGPLANNFGGDLGTQSALTVDYYYSGTIASGIFNDRERYWLVKNLGLVQWEHDTWNGSAWVIAQTNPFNLIRVGGGTSVIPVFGCTSASWWF